MQPPLPKSSGGVDAVFGTVDDTTKGIKLMSPAKELAEADGTISTDANTSKDANVVVKITDDSNAAQKESLRCPANSADQPAAPSAILLTNSPMSHSLVRPR